MTRLREPRVDERYTLVLVHVEQRVGIPAYLMQYHRRNFSHFHQRVKLGCFG